MKDLSIIVPFCNEWPMIPFTIRSIFEELDESGIDFEVITVNNYCPEVEEQHEAEIKSYTAQLLDTGVVDTAHLDREYFNITMRNYLSGRRQALDYKTKLKAIEATLHTDFGFPSESSTSKEIEKLKELIKSKDEGHWYEDPGGGQLKGMQRSYPWLKYFEYTDKLSHWQAKNLGVQNSEGKILMFIDAHCMIRRDSIVKMYDYYLHHHEELNGTLHLPLSYHIIEARKLIYKLAIDTEKGWYHYSFTNYRDNDVNPGIPYEVPCMSTCGMMMTRELYNLVGGWPTELGIYGGGENFLNYTLSVLGKHKYIMPGKQLCHHGAGRGYHWNYNDHLRNRIIATYMFGGADIARKFTEHAKGRSKTLFKIFNEVLDNESCVKHRALIKANQVMTIDEWLVKWR